MAKRSKRSGDVVGARGKLSSLLVFKIGESLHRGSL